MSKIVVSSGRGTIKIATGDCLVILTTHEAADLIHQLEAELARAAMDAALGPPLRVVE